MHTVEQLVNVGLLDKRDAAREILNLPEAREEFVKAFEVDINGTIRPFNPDDGTSLDANDQTLKTTSTVQAGLLAKSLPISIMEIFVSRPNKTGGKEKDLNHSLQFILNKKPNSYTTRNVWFSAAVYHLEYYGNHYARIHGSGKNLELEMVHPNRVEVRSGRDENDRPFLVYRVKQKDDETKTFQSFEFIHVKGFGENVSKGDKLSKRGGNDFGWEIDLNTYGKSFFHNGAKPANAIEQDVSLAAMNIDKQKQVRDDYQNHQGTKAGGTTVLQPGWKLVNTAHSNEQNQFIDSRTHAIQNAARHMNVPLHKMKELSRGTFNNLAVVEQSFARDSLQPITESIEAEYADKLFSKKESDAGYELIFDFKKLLKFDPEARSKVFNTAISSGYMTQNEVRVEESMNPYKGVGDDPMVNGGMIFIKDLDKEENNE